MEEETKQCAIVCSAIAAVMIALVSFGGSCEQGVRDSKAKAFTACVEKTSEPAECGAALR